LAAELQVVDTLLEHLPPVAEHMRLCDQREVWAAAHATPIQALLEGYNHSVYRRTLLVNGVPVMVAGAAEVPGRPDYGVPWALASVGWYDVSRGFLRVCRAYVAEMQRHYRYLENLVDARNEDSIRWLVWCGFIVDIDAIIFGPERRPFFRFHKLRCEGV